MDSLGRVEWLNWPFDNLAFAASSVPLFASFVTPMTILADQRTMELKRLTNCAQAASSRDLEHNSSLFRDEKWELDDPRGLESLQKLFFALVWYLLFGKWNFYSHGPLSWNCIAGATIANGDSTIFGSSISTDFFFCWDFLGIVLDGALRFFSGDDFFLFSFFGFGLFGLFPLGCHKWTVCTALPSL